MNAIAASVTFYFVVVSLIHLVQCRDIGSSALNDQGVDRSGVSGDGVTFISRSRGFASGDETDELTLELTPLDNLPLSRRKRAFISPGSYVAKAFLVSIMILNTIARTISSFVKGLT